MENLQPISSETQQASHCPVDHIALSPRKVERPTAPVPAIECDEKGIWHIHRFELGRAMLRGTQTQQAGFGAELINLAVMANLPVLYAEGKAHTEQRKLTARFFTPTAVSIKYREFMEAQVDQLISGFKKQGQADLGKMSLTMAVQTVARVLGLNYSLFGGMEDRLDAFFSIPFELPGSSLLSKLQMVWNTRIMLAFFVIDVRPAIAVHKKQDHDDLISHLIGQKYNDREILTEVVTFGAAGMATTREFISMAAWHFLENPDLRLHYLKAEEPERLAILHEILRVEPVVGHVLRTATDELTLTSEGQNYVIPKGAVIDFDIYSANTETTMVGEEPHAVCAGREIHGDQVSGMLMSFGDGHHRCPGAYIAIQETDIFLRKLLAMETLHITKPPSVTWGALSTGYELRNFMIGL